MPTIGSDQPYGAHHMIERQMLLHDARERALREKPGERPQLRYRFITLSRDLGSLGDEVAGDLAGHLGWHVYDREIVDYIAANSHVRGNLVRQLDEKTQNLVHETVQRILRLAQGVSFGVEEYRESLLKTLGFIAARGEAIILGRGANFALRGSDGLHVRIVASETSRIDRLRSEWRVSAEETRQRLEIMESERRDFIRRHFHHELDDLSWYDAAFCLDHMSVPQVTAAILSLLEFPGPAHP